MSEETREGFDALNQMNRERKAKNLQEFDPEGWTRHTPWHYSRDLCGDRIDYWPSTTRHRWRGRVRIGGVMGFIKNQEAKNRKKT